ncbi:hypothetical protein KO465_01940 [Candidatus Micrarchaeota archaeon]|jgi:hypothetical protein|nr:hypothetical protein [Candidatus Micrarchaeota archaeon]
MILELGDVENIIYYGFILLNLLYGLYLVYWFIKRMNANDKISLNYSYYLFALTMVLVVFIPVLELFQALPGWPWHIIKMISLFLFLISLKFVMGQVDSTITAYEHLKKPKYKREG